MKRGIKNHGKSVRARLLALMKKSGYKYMYLLTRYFNERLLYRVSVSRYRDNFLLKGGSLLYAFEGMEARPTIDIDFLARRISRESSELERVFREILEVECEEDGVAFDVNSLRTEPITVEKEYPGTRIFVTALMDTIVFPMTIDIGFGDVITPSPIDIDFPQLLSGVPTAKVKAYSMETVVAEKFHAMIERDVANSRMKDFFDCYQILTTKELDDNRLFEAIKATFDNRGLSHNEDLKLFTAEFSMDAARQARWSAFLQKIQWKEELTFEDVMDEIRRRLQPMYEHYFNL